MAQRVICLRVKCRWFVSACVLMLCFAGCRETTRFRGSIHDLAPQQIGEYKRIGEATPMEIPPPSKNDSAALRPTAGLNAKYEAPDRTRVDLQIINYASAGDAQEAFRRMQQNFQTAGNTVELAKTARTGKNGQPPGPRMIVKGVSFQQIIWIDTSLLYALSGKKLESILEIEHGLP